MFSSRTAKKDSELINRFSPKAIYPKKKLCGGFSGLAIEGEANVNIDHSFHLLQAKNMKHEYYIGTVVQPTAAR